MWVQALCLLFVLPACLACAYYLALALVGLLIRRVPETTPHDPIHSFAILVPAHNEERIIGDVLRCCDALDYPPDRFQVFVVADNCTDRTAALAEQLGATCLVRRDESNKGKGHALAWALPQVLSAGHDAVVILDADCLLEAHALRVFDRSLQAGHRVLQAKVVVSNPGASVTSYAAAVGNVLENDHFYRPKARLGLPVFLRGTGMVFQRTVLEEHPWQARSIVEDTEYTVRLLRAGLRVQFLDDVRVLTVFPDDFRQMNIQRQRWTAGTFRFGRLRAGRLILEGLRHGRAALVDAGWTMLILVKPLIMVHLLLALLAAAVCQSVAPGPLATGLLAVSAALPMCYVGYVLLGILHLGVNARRLALLGQLPLVVLSMVFIFLKGTMLPRKDVWGPCPRSAQSRHEVEPTMSHG